MFSLEIYDYWNIWMHWSVTSQILLVYIHHIWINAMPSFFNKYSHQTQGYPETNPSPNIRIPYSASIIDVPRQAAFRASSSYIPWTDGDFFGLTDFCPHTGGYPLTTISIKPLQYWDIVSDWFSVRILLLPDLAHYALTVTGYILSY